MFKNLVIAFVATFVLSTGTVFAQEIAIDMSAGGSMHLSGEEETFALNSFSGLFHMDVLGIDFMDASSGVGVEAEFSGVYTVWSLNRAVVPGTNGVIYGGTDLKLFQSDSEDRLHRDFDLRIVTGVKVGEIGGGDVSFEMYFVEENKPVSMSVLYNW